MTMSVYMTLISNSWNYSILVFIKTCNNKFHCPLKVSCKPCILYNFFKIRLKVFAALKARVGQKDWSKIYVIKNWDYRWMKIKMTNS